MRSCVRVRSRAARRPAPVLDFCPRPPPHRPEPGPLSSAVSSWVLVLVAARRCVVLSLSSLRWGPALALRSPQRNVD
eukprot:5417694-Pleurochrysis_carterae.AAC.1